jgi:hypothetical protein
LTPKIIDTVGSSIAIGGIAQAVLDVGDGLADGDVLDPGEADDVAGRASSMSTRAARRRRTAW